MRYHLLVLTSLFPSVVSLLISFTGPISALSLSLPHVKPQRLITSIQDPYHDKIVKHKRKQVSVLCKASTSTGEDDSVKKDDPTAPVTWTQIVDSAFLVAGTTIGGGFLALPSVVSRSEFYPSAVTLTGVWAYFLAQSFVLVECIRRTKETTTTSNPGVAAVAKSVFGVRGEAIIGFLLAVIIEATLVSQISRAGLMFPNSYALGCALSALSTSAIVFGPKSGISFASKANSVLTTLFLLSTMCVFACGMGIADWTRLGGLGGGLSSSSLKWASVSSMVPTFLQLLVYGEILPTVCQVLQYKTKHIHTAITLGSFMTLCLMIGWSGLGIALVSSSSSNLDPVTVLLTGSGPVKVPLFSLALTAILTTILGSYLALLSTANDIFIRNQGAGKMERSLGGRIKAASVITLPAMCIASTSPSVFLKAIDFAGSYPVLLLWGVAPPIMALIQRAREPASRHESESQYNSSRTSGPSAWLFSLASVSLCFVGINAYQDWLSFVNTILT